MASHSSLLVDSLLYRLSSFAFFSFATHIAAITLAYSGFIYIIASLKDEKARDLKGYIDLANARKRRKPSKKGKEKAKK